MKTPCFQSCYLLGLTSSSGISVRENVARGLTGNWVLSISIPMCVHVHTHVYLRAYISLCAFLEQDMFLLFYKNIVEIFLTDLIPAICMLCTRAWILQGLKIKPLLSRSLFLLRPMVCLFPNTDVFAWLQLWAWSYGVSWRVQFKPV